MAIEHFCMTHLLALHNVVSTVHISIEETVDTIISLLLLYAYFSYKIVTYIPWLIL